MNKLMAGAGLAMVAWLCSYAYRSGHRKRETRNVREQVRRWEGEGGSVPAPDDSETNAAAVSGSAS